MTVATINVTARRPPPAMPAPAARRAVLRVMMVDALPLAAHGLHALVEATRGLAWCGAARSVPAALVAVREVRPNIVLVDSDLDRDARGLRALRSACPDVLLVGLVRDDHRAAADYLPAARVARVNGLVARSAAPNVLLAAIRAVHDGHTFLDPQLTTLSTGARASDEAVIPKPTSRLSARQREVLSLIARGQHNAEIAELLAVSVETVRTHVKEVLRKLSTRDRAHAVARGYQLGLLGD